MLSDTVSSVLRSDEDISPEAAAILEKHAKRQAKVRRHDLMLTETLALTQNVMIFQTAQALLLQRASGTVKDLLTREGGVFANILSTGVFNENTTRDSE
jgi:hypothetical protein